MLLRLPLARASDGGARGLETRSRECWNRIGIDGRGELTTMIVERGQHRRVAALAMNGDELNDQREQFVGKRTKRAVNGCVSDSQFDHLIRSPAHAGRYSRPCAAQDVHLTQ